MCLCVYFDLCKFSAAFLFISFIPSISFVTILDWLIGSNVLLIRILLTVIVLLIVAIHLLRHLGMLLLLILWQLRANPLVSKEAVKLTVV